MFFSTIITLALVAQGLAQTSDQQEQTTIQNQLSDPNISENETSVGMDVFPSMRRRSRSADREQDIMAAVFAISAGTRVGVPPPTPAAVEADSLGKGDSKASEAGTAAPGQIEVGNQLDSNPIPVAAPEAIVTQEIVADSSSTPEKQEQQPPQPSQEQLAPPESEPETQLLQQQQPQELQQPQPQQQQPSGDSRSNPVISPSPQQDQQRLQKTQRDSPIKSNPQQPRLMRSSPPAGNPTMASSRAPHNDRSPVAPVGDSSSFNRGDVQVKASDGNNSPNSPNSKEQNSGQARTTGKNETPLVLSNGDNFQDSESTSPQPNVGLYVGIVFGLVFLICLAVFVTKRMRQKRVQADEENAETTEKWEYESTTGSPFESTANFRDSKSWNLPAVSTSQRRASLWRKGILGVPVDQKDIKDKGTEEAKESWNNMAETTVSDIALEEDAVKRIASEAALALDRANTRD